VSAKPVGFPSSRGTTATAQVLDRFGGGCRGGRWAGGAAPGTAAEHAVHTARGALTRSDERRQKPLLMHDSPVLRENRLQGRFPRRWPRGSSVSRQDGAFGIGRGDGLKIVGRAHPPGNEP